jgi:sulfur carrier protein
MGVFECQPAANGICYGFPMASALQLVINGEEQSRQAGTLEELIAELGLQADRVAVELNRRIVPRAEWSAAALQDGDRLEIVHFVGGG